MSNDFPQIPEEVNKEISALTDRKRQPRNKNLSIEEQDFITMNAADPLWSDARIARHLGRSEETIKRFRKRNNIRRDKNNSKDVTKKAATEEPKKESRNKIDTIQKHIDESNAKKKKYFKDKFTSSMRSPRVVKSLSREDYDFFVDRWSEYHLQFTDMTSSEEDTLEKMILLDIRLAHNQSNLRKCHQIQEKLSDAMSKREELDPENERDLQILHTIDSYNGKELELNKEFRELSKEYNELQKSLNATREQREANQKIGADTFFDLIKNMQNSEYRDKAARMNELMKMSRDKKIKDLQEPHKFVDGQYDYPMLDGEVFKRKAQEKIEESKDE